MQPAALSNPAISGTTPANGAVEVLRDSSIVASVQRADSGAGINPATLTASNVKLTTASNDNIAITLSLNSAGNVVVTPIAILPGGKQLTIRLTSGVKDTAGASLTPFQMSFTTGHHVTREDTNIRFTQTDLPTTHNRMYTALAWGPDGKLYAGTLDGLILRFPVSTNGTLGTPETFTTVNRKNGGTRAIIGLEFDPTSTADNLILWVSHSEGPSAAATDWTGKISRLRGASLSQYTDFVVNLPRSISDHMTNQLHFGPDGALYVAQGSMNAMGDPDSRWQRPERLLTAAILRVDVRRINSVVDVKTPEGGGPYNPHAAGALVTLYATGVRNTYDFVWASNGHLYAPTNGSAAGGSIPAGPNNNPPALNNVPIIEDDWLLDIKKGGYYGHPDPLRKEYIFNGGNPTSGADAQEMPLYPVGTQPDPNYRRPIMSLGKGYAPTGVIEYKSNTFGGRLKGRLLMTRYSSGDDLYIMTINKDGTASGINGIGMDGFEGPTDLIEDARNGNIYVAALGNPAEPPAPGTDPAGMRITLLRPSTAALPTITKLQLINTDATRSLGAIKNRQTINLAELPTRNLSIKALTSGGVGSVRFGLDGNADYQLESFAPFSLKGDNPDGTFKPWTPSLGKHVLTVTPYSGPNGTGTAGSPVALTFYVVNIPSAQRVDVNFQPASVTASFPRTRLDVGRTYGMRGNGFMYGWRTDNTANTFVRNSSRSTDVRFDTGAVMGTNRWDLAVKNGTYSVYVLAGDPTTFGGSYGINVEGVLAISGTPTRTKPWLGKTLRVTVTDNTLTITTTPGSSGNKINLVQVRPV